MSLISPFDPWQSKLCTCPKKFSLSPYTGCGHACLYCYASSYIPNFYQPRSKINFIAQLAKELRKLPKNSYLTLANSSDPYQPLEKKENLTRSFLRLLLNNDFQSLNLKIMFVTKSDLILKDLDLLFKLKNVVIAFSLTTLNKTLAKKIEPKAPEPKLRLKAMAEISNTLPVICRLDPLIYPLNIEEIEELVQASKEAGAKQIITSTFKSRTDSLQRMIKAFPELNKLWHELYLEKGEKLNNYYYLPFSLRKKIIEKVRKTALKEKLSFSSCREGLGQQNTGPCDGSAWF